MFAIILMPACSSNKPDEDVAPKVVKNVYDNGRNIGWINATSTTESIPLLQTWIAEHPDKIITAISADATASYGKQTGWMFIYYDKSKFKDNNECCDSRAINLLKIIEIKQHLT